MVTVTIAKRVGKGRPLPRTDSDVDKVARLLEQVPVDQGGPQPGFYSSFTLVDLEKAISNFQAYQFGQVTGFIDPDNMTIHRLNLYAAGQRPGIDAIAWQFKAQRNYIVQCAHSLVGKISNAMIDQKSRERHGWRELWEIHHSAGLSVESEAAYNTRKAAPVFRPIADGTIPFDYIKYVKSNTPGPAWCGIFATWALNQAGFNVKWRINRGIAYQNGVPLSLAGAQGGVTVGDVCIVNDRSPQVGDNYGSFGMQFYKQFLSHHIIVASHPTPQGTIDVIEGNYPHLQLGAHSIVDDLTRMPQRKRNVSEIVQRYELFQPHSM